jgi:hypothetical protein
MEVLVNGKPVQEYLHESKTYIEGKEGTEFSLRLKNNSGHRVLFVPTIDGLSVMDGKEASFNSRGYIVDSYSSDTIDGWRTSDDDVAKFFFSKLKESYAAKSGKSGNQGVIGCAVFEENDRSVEIKHIHIHRPARMWGLCNWCCKYHWSDEPCYPIQQFTFYSGTGYTLTGSTMGSSMTVNTVSMNASNSSNSLNASASNANQQLSDQMQDTSLGTGLGDEKYSPVRTVEFDRKATPSVVFNIFYNTRKNLEAMGVQFKKPLKASPSAFPKESGYCEPPRE